MLVVILGIILVISLCAAFCSLEFIKKPKLKHAIYIVALCLFVLSIVGLVYQAPIYEAECAANYMQNMQQAVGITNDKECQMIISQSINATGELHGTMFLFAGSINGTVQDNLRMGYIAPNGVSYIISVPIKKVTFLQKENVLPSGSFHFINWQKDLTLQDNVNRYLGKIMINLTPDEFQKLIQ